jgi:sugar/nucleoside kinase (ribokinase family)
MDFDIFVIGDCFFDVCVNPPGDALKGGVYDSDISFSSGGLANLAVWSSRYGARVGFCGAVGDDVLGDKYEKDAEADGVRTMLIRDNQRQTGVCVSLVSADGDRTMLTSRDANDGLLAKDVMPRIPDAAYYYFSGYSFGSPGTGEEVMRIIDDLHGKGRRIIFNLGSFNFVRDNLRQFRSIAAKSEILIMNRDEASAFTKEKDAGKIVACLKKLGRKFVITLGAEGSVSYDGERVLKSGAVPVAKVVDATGAGDAFAGGFTAGLAGKMGFSGSVMQGHEAAAKVVGRMGAR